MKFQLAAIGALATSLVAAAPLVAVGDLATRDSDSKTTGKRGVLYLNSDVTTSFPDPPFAWSYNYQSSPGASKTGEFVPMLYNGTDASWHTNVQAEIKSGTKHVMAFNEPDQPTSAGGTNLSPGEAASMYKSMMNPLKGQVKLGAPAVSAGGISWLQQFAAACAGECHVDFIPLHFYASASQTAQIQAVSMTGFMTTTIPQVRGYFNSKSLPIWITEFSAVPNQNIDVSVATAYMDAALPALDSNPAIQRYAYFQADQLATNGKLNAAGARYAAANNAN